MHKTVVIICDGEFPKTEYPRYLIRTADFIICCDGALKKFLRHSKGIFGEERLPDLVIGDMDSLSTSLKKKYGELILQVDEQEHNDQTKAFKWVMENLPDADHIYIIGATGGRLDHSIGNASLLMEYTRMFDMGDMNLEMVTDKETIFPITDSTEFDCGTGRQVSIFSPDNSLRIKSEGLAFPTEDVVFDNWWKATLNKATQDTVKLELNHPSIALVMIN